ncbi:monovalent cation:proton antiporter-2 (CPA2) family protein [Pseudogemmatithrix spongiicola]|uniref:Monovalent cation:proton antiporter-2 (CPA2) family protein n=1 Tax=Pseudogemmatithrix spongiicola TaxID=3062599 RepID=A0AA49Q475_9BACT|nr:monovalent cation:proton antiporter-2 (CPA2) family protein [Gemmatimonadaceae bacterium 'strain 138']WKW14501.1 monovalent cation:proton antiporter-2 (CPA2) family protein [Gemmatimonadaceae bacterium 'strain 318']
MQDFLLSATVYLAAAVIAVPIAKRLGLGSVLGYLIAGVVIGPSVLGVVGAEGQDVMHAAEFGVVMMLFVIGLELEPALLWRLRGALLGLGGAQVVITMLAVAGILAAFGFAWQEGLATGAILALSSTAIVLQSLQEKGWMRSDAGEKSFAVLLFQDLAVIPILALLPLLATQAVVAGGDGHGAGAWAEHLPGWQRALVTFGAVAAIVGVGRLVVPPAFRSIAKARLRETFTAAALLLVIGIAVLMQLVGLSPALGTFLGGVVLATSEFRHELESDVEPFKGLLLGVFFIAVGASIDFGLIGERLLLVSGAVVGLVALKFAVLWGIGRVAGMARDQHLLFALALAQGGEFGFVLVSFATQNGVLGEAVSGVLVAAIALSMAATPLLLLFWERVIAPRAQAASRPVRAMDRPESEHPVLIVGFGDFGSSVGRLLTAAGVECTVLDLDADRVDVLRRLGLRVYFGDASREDLLRSAGIERARLVILCVGDAAANLELARRISHAFPHVRVLARAAGRLSAYELYEAGVAHVYRESVDAAVRLGADALQALGWRAHASWRLAQAFRKRDEANTQRLASIFRDQEAHLSEARAAIRDLERTLRDDRLSPAVQDEAAWDAESLRREFKGMTDGKPPVPQ